MSLTKEQLKDQLTAYEQQVKSLQDELTERSFQLEEIDTLASEYEEEIVDLAEEIADSDALEAQVRDLTDMASGLASQLAWTISMVQSLALYQPNGPTTQNTLAESILEASEPFWTGFTQGLYEPAALLAQSQYEMVEVDDDEGVFAGPLLDESDFDIGAIITEFLSVAETEQEIPDEEPDGYTAAGVPFFVSEGVSVDENEDEACPVCGDSDCTA